MPDSLFEIIVSAIMQPYIRNEILIDEIFWVSEMNDESFDVCFIHPPTQLIVNEQIYGRW